MSVGVVALVPMRHHSERVTGKNYRQLGGRPLFHHVLEQLLLCEPVIRVVIDTDSPVIRESAAEAFPSVVVLERPPHLCAGTVPMNEVLLHDVRQVDGEVFLQTHSTNPFLRSSTILRAIDRFFEACPSHDSLFSVTRLNARLWDGMARAVNHNPALLVRTQDLPPLYLENSCLYLFARETLERHRSRIGQRPVLFEMDRFEAWDIDEEIDLAMAEALLRDRERRG
jgi:CMP-N-acetylneuraminic acid synthetase